MLNGGLYLAIGDSITRTVSDAAYTQADRNSLYCNLVRDYINTNYGKIKLIAKGIDGQKTKNAVLNYYYWSRFQPTIATIALGTNDCDGQDVSVTDYKANLSAMIDKLRTKNANVKIILCTPPGTSSATRTPYIAAYRTAMEEVSVSKNTYLCKFHEAVTAENIGSYSADGLHPNKAGHILLFNRIKPIIDEIMTEIAA